MSVIGSEILAGASGNQGYNIQRSLRFRSSASAYLSRTPASAGNRKTWTWSGWVKRGKLSAVSSPLFFVKGSSTDATYLRFGFDFAATDAFSLTSWNSTTIGLTTTQLFRDPSAWYHIIVAFDTTQATASNRVKIYVNGVQVTSFAAANYPALNTDCGINNNVEHDIFAAIETANYYTDGYLAEVNFIDGQALTPSSFGQTDATTGVWVPKKYAGTYGTNGFYLPFSNNTSATTLAYDFSGNGNNWTPNNISTTAGVTYDSMTDVPTLTSATAANFATLNPLKVLTYTPTNGNLTLGTASYSYGQATITDASGKSYAEATVTGTPTGSHVFVRPANAPLTAIGDINANNTVYYRGDGALILNGATVATYSSYTNNDVIGIALDNSTSPPTVRFYKNNTAQGASAYTLPAVTATGEFCIGGTCDASGFNFNFGQQGFSYTPPTGFVALNTFNLPDPTIKKPNQYMDAAIYTGNGTSPLQVVSNLGFQPDLVWNKTRSGATNHVLYDSVRGAGSGKALSSNLTDAEGLATSSNEDSKYGYLSSFNTNGYTATAGSLGFQYFNNNTTSYVGWCWKKGATPGFDIVTYTGDGTQPRQISHSLGLAPKFIITKCRNTAGYDWNCWFTGFANNDYIALNSTAAKASDPNTFPSAAGMTSTYFTVGSGLWINGSAKTYVAYLFAEIAGFSKFGSYTGNGSTDGPFVYCGFRPKYIMIKRTDSTSDWSLFDTSRSTYNGGTNLVNLWPNTAAAESNTWPFDLLSNGMKIRYNGVSQNASGGTYIYAAFAENPFKYSLAR